MDAKQQKWTRDKCDQLRQYIDNYFPLSEEQWESVGNYIEKIVELAKGNKEVRSALFDTVELYQKKAEELLKNAGT